MTKSIYDQHDAAFGTVTAAVIVKDGQRVATVTMKHGAAVTAYVHWIGTEMASGRANGGGYDKATAAVEAASAKLDRTIPIGSAEGVASQAFRDALRADDGRRWHTRLEDAGFDVLFAIA